jgi:hypothetical protein
MTTTIHLGGLQSFGGHCPPDKLAAHHRGLFRESV